jgi:predicted ATPase
MKIKVVTEASGVSERDTVLLLPSSWDDYHRKATFTAYYVDDEGRQNSLGEMKISHPGHDSGRVEIADNINELPETYISAGQGEGYYQTLSSLPNDKGRLILIAMRDAIFNDDLIRDSRSQSYVKNVLFRFLDADKTKRLRQVIRGAKINTSYSFLYSVNGIPLLNCSVDPNSEPSTNLQGLIGRNGVGKTTLMANIAHAACLQSDELEQHPKYGRFETASEYAAFGNVIALSFSAFDRFEVPRDDGTAPLVVPYHYVGLRVLEERRLKAPEETAADLLQSLERCLFSSRKDAWIESISILRNDPVFEGLPLGQLAAVSDPQELSQFEPLISSLSSGHLIVLLATTKLVELVEDRTLVLFDEPESHLHPPLLASLIRVISRLLQERNGVAIITTHSPVVLQELPSNCAWQVDRIGEDLTATPMQIETFGESVGTLTQVVFDLELKRSSYYAAIERATQNPAITSFEELLEQFSGHLGSEGRAVAMALLAARKRS